MNVNIEDGSQVPFRMRKIQGWRQWQLLWYSEQPGNSCGKTCYYPVFLNELWFTDHYNCSRFPDDTAQYADNSLRNCKQPTPYSTAVAETLMAVNQVQQMRPFMYSESTLSCSQEPTGTTPSTCHYPQSTDQGFYIVTKKKSTPYYPYSAFAIRNYENGNVKQLVLPHMSAFLIV